MDYAKIAWKLRGQIGRFSGELAAGFSKVVRRFIAEMFYGIQARQSVRLTEVVRALDEPMSIKKTEERLLRQLGRRWLGEAVTERVAEQAAREVDIEIPSDFAYDARSGAPSPRRHDRRAYRSRRVSMMSLRERSR